MLVYLVSIKHLQNVDKNYSLCLSICVSVLYLSYNTLDHGKDTICYYADIL